MIGSFVDWLVGWLVHICWFCRRSRTAENGAYSWNKTNTILSGYVVVHCNVLQVLHLVHIEMLVVLTRIDGALLDLLSPARADKTRKYSCGVYLIQQLVFAKGKRFTSSKPGPNRYTGSRLTTFSTQLNVGGAVEVVTVVRQNMHHIVTCWPGLLLVQSDGTTEQNRCTSPNAIALSRALRTRVPV